MEIEFSLLETFEVEYQHQYTLYLPKFKHLVTVSDNRVSFVQYNGLLETAEVDIVDNFTKCEFFNDVSENSFEYVLEMILSSCGTIVYLIIIWDRWTHPCCSVLSIHLDPNFDQNHKIVKIQCGILDKIQQCKRMIYNPEDSMLYALCLAYAPEFDGSDLQLMKLMIYAIDPATFTVIQEYYIADYATSSHWEPLNFLVFDKTQFIVGVSMSLLWGPSLLHFDTLTCKTDIIQFGLEIPKEWRRRDLMNVCKIGQDEFLLGTKSEHSNFSEIYHLKGGVLELLAKIGFEIDKMFVKNNFLVLLGKNGDSSCYDWKKDVISGKFQMKMGSENEYMQAIDCDDIEMNAVVLLFQPDRLGWFHFKYTPICVSISNSADCIFHFD